MSGPSPLSAIDTPNLQLFPEPVARSRLGGISRRKMSQLIRDGEIAVVRIGRRIFFTPESLQKFITDRTEGGR